MKILVTGGAGYIGSHIVKALINQGHDIIIFDNLSRGNSTLINPSSAFIKGDLLDSSSIDEVFKKNKIDCVIHLAGFAYVGESFKEPIKYYNNNVIGGLNLINAMVKFGVNKIIFSSSCTIFGNTSSKPINEDYPKKSLNPYGNTKLIIENILKECDCSYGLKSIILRYFNAAGASSDASIGEIHSPETHLIPLALYAASGKKDEIKVFGDDYPTPDGTCIRDYVHVEDIANAHLLAMNYLFDKNESNDFNLGIGKGYSVKQVINTVEEVTSCKIKSKIISRRLGDSASLISDNKKIKKILHWNPKYTELKDIIKTAWEWHKKNENINVA